MPHSNLVHSPFKPVKVYTALIIQNLFAVNGMVAPKAQPDNFPNPNALRLRHSTSNFCWIRVGTSQLRALFGYRMWRDRICQLVWRITVQRASAAIPLAERAYLRAYTHATSIPVAPLSKRRS